MSEAVGIVRDRAAGALEAGTALRASAMGERTDWLAAAATLLERAALDATDALSESTGLSVPMVRWAAQTTLYTVSEDALRSLAAEARADQEGSSSISMLSVILAGNVFTASVRAVFVPLLLGVPVLVKASRRETLFPELMKQALRSANPRLGSAMDLVVFAGGDLACEAALVESAEALGVYGSDETIAALASRLGKTPFISHGHGVSVAYCGRNALDPERLEDTVSALSLDICAYDQRGCLSPQLVYVEETSRCSAESFAKRLAADGLGPMSRTLPRGALPLSVGAAQAQWRGIAEVEGTLITGDSFAIAVRPAQPVRWSPAYRNVTIAPVRGADDALRAMKPMGQTLKCVGADPSSLNELRAGVIESTALSAYACALGEMQTPPLDAPADGRPVWHGLFRA